MKKLSLLGLMVLALVATSCAPLDPRMADNRPRFRDGAAADLVIIYYGEQSVFITKPDTREGGFLPLLSRENVTEYLARPEIRRNLGVVVVGQMATAEQDEAVLRAWQTQLTQHGFRRVVCLRAGSDDRIDGLPILQDSAIALRADEAAPAQTVATIPSAP